MLVLTRKPNQKIQIGQDVFVKILDVNGKQVRLGLTAPDDIPIMRTELLYNRKVKKKQTVEDVKEIPVKTIT